MSDIPKIWNTLAYSKDNRSMYVDTWSACFKTRERKRLAVDLAQNMYVGTKK